MTRPAIPLTQRLRDGRAVAVAACNPAPYTPELVEFLGGTGIDGVWIEGEHGTVDFQEIANLSRAADLWDMASIVRVHQNDPGLIGRVLDCGASGVCVPHVSTKEEARRVVEGGRFAPPGLRGMFGGRRSFGVDDYHRRANDEVCLVVLIEEQEAIDNLDEILTVDDIDVFHVAPSDLSQSMGHIGQVTHPAVQAAVDGAIEKILAAGRMAGTTTTDANRRRYLDMGVRFVYTSLLPSLAQAAKDFAGLVHAD